MAGCLGFEPRLTGSEPAGLPLAELPWLARKDSHPDN